MLLFFLFKKGYISINGVERLDSLFGNMVITVIGIKKTERLYYYSLSVLMVDGFFLSYKENFSGHTLVTFFVVG